MEESASYDEDSDIVIKTARRLVTNAISNAMQVVIMEARAVSVQHIFRYFLYNFEWTLVKYLTKECMYWFTIFHLLMMHVKILIFLSCGLLIDHAIMWCFYYLNVYISNDGYF